MQPLFFITVFLILSAMIVLESDTIKSQAHHRVVTTQTRQ
jgi:hypothetical protein